MAALKHEQATLAEAIDRISDALGIAAREGVADGDDVTRLGELLDAKNAEMVSPLLEVTHFISNG